MGFSLAKTIAEQLGPERLAEVDAVIPIPETSNSALDLFSFVCAFG